MTKKVFSTLAFVALLLGWSSIAASDESGVQAAKRYQAVQIRNDDVQLQNPELQEFLQSDVFRRIVEDKKFLQAAWARQIVRAALGNVDLERVRHEINEIPTPGLWRLELQRVQLELDGIPYPCGPCRG